METTCHGRLKQDRCHLDLIFLFPSDGSCFLAFQADLPFHDWWKSDVRQVLANEVNSWNRRGSCDPLNSLIFPILQAQFLQGGSGLVGGWIPQQILLWQGLNFDLNDRAPYLVNSQYLLIVCQEASRSKAQAGRFRTRWDGWLVTAEFFIHPLHVISFAHCPTIPGWEVPMRTTCYSIWDAAR